VNCARLAFEALPDSVKQRYFAGFGLSRKRTHPVVERPRTGVGTRRGDWLRVSAVMSKELTAAVAKVPEATWQTIRTEADGTCDNGRSDFVPGTGWRRRTAALALCGFAPAQGPGGVVCRWQ